MTISQHSRVFKCLRLSIFILGALSSGVGADTVSWSVAFHAWGGQTGTWSSAEFGTGPLDSSDGYDEWDRLASPGSLVNLGTYHEEGAEGWSGPTGFYWLDVRRPCGEIGKSKTWRFYLWADPLLSDDVAGIRLDSASNGVSGMLVTLTLRAKPAGLAGGPPLGTVWRLPPFGTLATLPVYRTDNGLDGYVFDLTATVVPEPSSLLALSAGLAGMAGALRRRAGAG